MIPHDFKHQVWNKVRHSPWRILGELAAALVLAAGFYCFIILMYAYAT